MTSSDPSDMDMDDFYDEMESSIDDIDIPDFDELTIDSDTVKTPDEVAQAFYRIANRDVSEESMVRGIVRASPPMDDETVSRLYTDESAVEIWTITIDIDMANNVIERIGEEIERREKQGFTINRLVLGQPQYETLTAYAQSEYDGDAESVFPVDEIIVVPGPMIHPVIDNKRMLMEYKIDD